jgi:hypothetical protein
MPLCGTRDGGKRYKGKGIASFLKLFIPQASPFTFALLPFPYRAVKRRATGACGGEAIMMR